MPKKRPVGAFRGGYVSAESYWRSRMKWGGGGAARQSIAGAGCNAQRDLSGRKKKKT